MVYAYSLALIPAERPAAAPTKLTNGFVSSGPRVHIKIKHSHRLLLMGSLHHLYDFHNTRSPDYPLLCILWRDYWSENEILQSYIRFSKLRSRDSCRRIQDIYKPAHVMQKCKPRSSNCPLPLSSLSNSCHVLPCTAAPPLPRTTPRQQQQQ